MNNFIDNALKNVDLTAVREAQETSEEVRKNLTSVYYHIPC